MKNFFFILAICACIAACSSIKENTNMSSNNNSNDTIRIANDSLDYELIVFETGFNSWLVTQPPRGHYAQSYLELKNRNFVVTYNSRVIGSQNNADLYPQQINYDYDIDYGYEVNYLLYNYFLFFQEKYQQKL